jgi:cysteinyl-tRNA synthetase
VIRPLPAGAAEKILARQAARQARDFAAADRLRDELTDIGVTVIDTPGGQEWTVDARSAAHWSQDHKGAGHGG